MPTQRALVPARMCMCRWICAAVHVRTCVYIYREAPPPRVPAQPESPAFVSGKSAADVGVARAGGGGAAGERRAGGLVSEEVVETCGGEGKVGMQQEEEEEMETVLDFKGGGFGVDAEKVCLCVYVCRCVPAFAGHIHIHSHIDVVDHIDLHATVTRHMYKQVVTVKVSGNADADSLTLFSDIFGAGARESVARARAHAAPGLEFCGPEEPISARSATVSSGYKVGARAAGPPEPVSSSLNADVGESVVGARAGALVEVEGGDGHDGRAQVVESGGSGERARVAVRHRGARSKCGVTAAAAASAAVLDEGSGGSIGNVYVCCVCAGGVLCVCCVLCGCCVGEGLRVCTQDRGLAVRNARAVKRQRVGKPTSGLGE